MLGAQEKSKKCPSGTFATGVRFPLKYNRKKEQIKMVPRGIANFLIAKKLQGPKFFLECVKKLPVGGHRKFLRRGGNCPVAPLTLRHWLKLYFRAAAHYWMGSTTRISSKREVWTFHGHWSQWFAITTVLFWVMAVSINDPDHNQAEFAPSK